ncbi:MAG: dihydroorotate dehydrogenase electron transfer subunit [Clostridiales bacterium]|nr:dihydroorotate dehydrogenase electron transfer subunit [Clostridiales bacterium]
MKQTVLTVKENRALAKSVYIMTLGGDTGANKPGQFVEIKLDGLYLRRPISVCDCENGYLTIIYKVVGSGTEQMTGLKEGDRLDVLTCLGNGYDLAAAGDRPLLIGGGVGVPPMYLLAKELIKQGKEVSVILGFNTRDEVFFEDEFASLGCSVTVTTADGSYGVRGFVTDALPDNASYFYACGPKPMLRALSERTDIPGEFSLEERMGCGFGACMGCSVMTKSGAKRVCKDGPVFKKEELIW